MPETYVLNRRGRIVAHLAGPITAPGFRSEFSSALAKRGGVILRFLAVVVAALAFAGPAAAASCAHPRTSLAHLEGQVMCPTCHTTLDQSDSAAARQIEAYISQRIAQCATVQQIESELVANYGPAILAAPPHKGFDLLAWWLPIVGVLARRGRPRGRRLALESRDGSPRRRSPEASGLDEETERELDDLLARFD